MLKWYTGKATASPVIGTFSILFFFVLLGMGTWSHVSHVKTHGLYFCSLTFPAFAIAIHLSACDAHAPFIGGRCLLHGVAPHPAAAAAC